LADPVEREHYEEIVAEKLGVSLEALRGKEVEGAGRVRRLKSVRDGLDSGVTDCSVAEKNLAAVAAIGGVEVDKELICSKLERNELELIYEYRYADWTQENLAEEAKELTKRIKSEKTQKQKEGLMVDLAAAEDRGDDKEVERLMKEIDKINRKK